MKLAFLIVISIFFISCNKNKNTGFIDEENVSVFNLERMPTIKDPFIELDSFIDSVKYVELEVSPESLISVMSNIFICDKYIITVSKKDGEVLFFDSFGKYSHKINKKGKGPGEYIYLSHAMIDTKSEEVLIYDHDNRRLNYYSFDGRFKRSIDNFSQGAIIRQIINKSDGGFVCYTFDLLGGEENYYGIWEVDSTGNFVKYYREEQGEFPLSFPMNSYSLYHLPDNKIGFMDLINCNIGYIDDCLHVTQKFKFPGKTILDYKGIRSISNEESFKIFDVLSHFEKGACRVTTLGFEGNLLYVLYDKKQQTFQSSSCILNKFENKPMLIGNPVPNNTTSVLTTVISADLISMLYNHPEKDANDLVKDIVKDKNQDQILNMNPVIQIMYMKE